MCTYINIDMCYVPPYITEVAVDQKMIGGTFTQNRSKLCRSSCKKRIYRPLYKGINAL